MKTISLAALTEKIRDRLQDPTWGSNTNITEDSARDLINGACGAFQAKLAECYGDDYYLSRVEFDTNPGDPLVDLPADFYKLKKLWWKVEPGARPKMREITRGGPDDLYLVEHTRVWNEMTPAYVFSGNSMYLMPAPQEAYTCVIWYVPDYIDMEGPSSTISVGPWAEWIVMEVCKIMTGEREKRDDDFARFERAQTGIEIRMKSQAPDRHETTAMQVRDTRRGRGRMGDQERRDLITTDPYRFGR